MQFNYNVNGLNIDVLGLANQKAKLESIKSDKLMRENATKEKERLSRLVKQRAEAVTNGKSTTGIDRLMFEINPDFAIQNREFESEMNEESMTSMYDTIEEAKILADNGQIEAAANMVEQRNQMLKDGQQPNKETQMIVDAFNTGDITKINQMLDIGMQMGQQGGYLEVPSPDDLEVLSKSVDAQGNEYYNVFNKTNQTMSKQFTGGVKPQDGSEDYKPGKDVSKFIVDAGLESEKFANESRTASRLADAYAEVAADPSIDDAGVPAMAERFLRTITGQENAESFMRKEATRLINSGIIGDLPPGVASDRDIAIISEGYPKSTNNARQMANWFRAYAATKDRLSRLKNGRSEFSEMFGGFNIAKQAGTLRGMEVKKNERFDQYYERLVTSQREERDRARTSANNERDLEAAIGGTGGLGDAPPMTPIQKQIKALEDEINQLGGKL